MGSKVVVFTCRDILQNVTAGSTVMQKEPCRGASSNGGTAGASCARACVGGCVRACVHVHVPMNQSSEFQS